MRRRYQIIVVVLALGLFPCGTSGSQELISGEPNQVMRFPVAHLHTGFSRVTFCYGYLLVSRNEVAYEVQKTEEGRNLDKDKSHGFRARPDRVEVPGFAALKHGHGPEGLELRVGGKTGSLFHLSDWTTLRQITSGNRPIMKPTATSYPALTNFDALLGSMTPATPQPVTTTEAHNAAATKSVELGTEPLAAVR